jgi:hypothetical protein
MDCRDNRVGEAWWSRFAQRAQSADGARKRGQYFSAADTASYVLLDVVASASVEVVLKVA